MKRHELTDEQWAAIEPIVCRKRQRSKASLRKGGRPRRDVRTLVNGIFWILATGAPWRDLPERFGPWRTVYHHFSKWRREGAFDAMLSTLQVRLDRDGHIDWDLWCVDGTQVRASRAAGGASKKASGSTRESPRTTLWAAREAGLGASSTWLLTAEALPSPSKSRQAKSTSRRGSSRS